MKNGYISLTEDEAWDNIWRKARLPQVIKEPYAPNYVRILDQFFKQYLPQNEHWDFLELGCAPGRWSHYFHTEFGYKVSGIDNSASGIELTRRNLELLGVKADLFAGNVLDYKFTKQFDVVFSMGLIEHFDPPAEIVNKHISLVKKGGLLVIGVPNIKKSVYGLIQWLVDKENLKGYIHVSKKDLLNLMTARGMEPKFCDHLGVFNLYLLNIPPKRRRLYRIIATLAQISEKLINTFHIKGETSLFSPYILIIAKKV